MQSITSPPLSSFGGPVLHTPASTDDVTDSYCIPLSVGDLEAGESLISWSKVSMPLSQLVQHFSEVSQILINLV